MGVAKKDYMTTASTFKLACSTISKEYFPLRSQWIRPLRRLFSTSLHDTGLENDMEEAEDYSEEDKEALLSAVRAEMNEKLTCKAFMAALGESET